MAAPERPNSGYGWLLYSAFAETFRAFRRIDFAAWLRWLLDLLKPLPLQAGQITSVTTSRGLFHRDQSLKQKKNLNSFARR